VLNLQGREGDNLGLLMSNLGICEDLSALLSKLFWRYNYTIKSTIIILLLLIITCVFTFHVSCIYAKVISVQVGPVLRQGYVPAKQGRKMKSRKTRPK
jgi:hypothetical protein